MKCVICGGQTIKKITDYMESGVYLGNFKAYVCQKCSETYFDEKTAKKIQDKSKKIKLFGLNNI